MGKMIQKDYKEIAGIIKEHYKGITSEYRLRTLSNKLSDYFERENDIRSCNCSFNDNIHSQLCYSLEGFNKQQFLKECGVND